MSLVVLGFVLGKLSLFRICSSLNRNYFKVLIHPPPLGDILDLSGWRGPERRGVAGACGRAAGERGCGRGMAGSGGAVEQ